MTETAEHIPDTSREINELEKSRVAESADTREQDSKNYQVGKKRGRPPALSHVRGWRRRNNIQDLDGLAREHGRLLAAMLKGAIPLDAGEVLSRTFVRHREILSGRDEIYELRAMHAKLIALDRRQGIGSIIDVPAA